MYTLGGNNLFRSNEIKIALTPNMQYMQLDESRSEKLLKELGTIQLTPLQVEELVIVKSYETHVTDVTLTLNNIDQNVAALIGEGKYIIQIAVSGVGTHNESTSGQNNYFICSNIEYPDGYIWATIKVASLKLQLKSLTRFRLELENNFAFELGGKGPDSAIGAGENPLNFLHSELSDLYSQNYLPEETVSGSTGALFDFNLVDFTEASHLTSSTPSAGYKMEADTNFKVLDFFFKHYPIFKSPYGWLIDDFTLSGTMPTTLKLANFTQYTAWRNHIDLGLSKLFNKKIPPGKGLSQEFMTSVAATFFKTQATERVGFWNLNQFLITDKFPKLFALDVIDNNPLTLSSWNAMHEEKIVLINDSNTLYAKKIKNPMYKEYLTFLNENEIQQTQLFKTIFHQLHPELVTYTMDNLIFGDIDLHTVVRLENEALGDTGYGVDRYGMCFKVKHEFKRLPLQTSGYYNQQGGKADDSQENEFMSRYRLDTTFTLLVVDEGPIELDITEGGEDHATQTGQVVGYDSPYTYDNGCGGGSGTYGDGGGLPMNGDIADNGQKMVENHFVYAWGGTSIKAMDCSAFTQKAVQGTGIKNYPRTTHTQLPWCKKYAKPVSFKNMQRGDILFFLISPKRAPVSHTGIASSSTHMYHASSAYGKGVEQKVSAWYQKRLVGIYRIPSPNRPKKTSPELKTEKSEK